MLPPLPRCSSWAYSSLISPGRISLPRKGCRVGLHIVLFEVCSAFTRVAACTLARSPIRDPLSEGFRHFVASMPAPVASGWSGCRVGLAPTGKRRLVTAHTQTRPSRPRQWVIGSARKLPFAPESPLCGNRRLHQLVEQRLGLFEVGGVEAFGEPGEDRGEQGDCLLLPAPLAAQAGEARRGAQFPGLRVLPAGDGDGFLVCCFGLAH